MIFLWFIIVDIGKFLVNDFLNVIKFGVKW